MACKIKFENNMGYVLRSGNASYVSCTGELPIVGDTGIPVALSGISYQTGWDVQSNLGGWRVFNESEGCNSATGPSCWEDTSPVVYQWTYPPVSGTTRTHLPDLFIIKRADYFPEPVMTAGINAQPFIDAQDITNTPLDSGIYGNFNGQYCQYHHPFVSGYYHPDITNVFSFSPDSVTGTGWGVVATEQYDVSSPQRIHHSMVSMEFSSGNYPKIEFTSSAAATAWASKYNGTIGTPPYLAPVNSYGLIAAQDTNTNPPSWAYTPEQHEGDAAGLYGGYGWTSSGVYAWCSVLERTDDYNAGLTTEQITAISVQRQQDLLLDIQTRGAGNSNIYFNLDVTDELVIGPCASPGGALATGANPNIWRRKWMEAPGTGGQPRHYSPIGHAYNATGFIPACMDFPVTYIIKGMNKYGQGDWIAEENLNLTYLSKVYTSYHWANWHANGVGIGDNILTYCSNSPAPTSPWLDENGNTWTLLAATGILLRYGGPTTTSTTWNGPNEIILTNPSQCWYDLRAQDKWRVSGPSGEELVTTDLYGCSIGIWTRAN